jgi:hypothetical protein
MLSSLRQENTINESDDETLVVQEEEQHYHVLDNINRVYCISDLHTDHYENLEWLHQKLQNCNNNPAETTKTTPTQNDLIIVAGDISHEYDRFSETLTVLRQCGQVLFVPGNHEAWLNKHDKHHYSYHDHHYSSHHHHHKDNNNSNNTTSSSSSSLDKLNRIYKMCQEHDVYTKPLLLINKNNRNNRRHHPLWILPLQCWYDGTLSFAEEHCQDFNTWPWVDFIRCEWPSHQFPTVITSSSKPNINGRNNNNGRIPMGLTEYFLQQNEEYLQHIRPMILEQQQQQQATTTTHHNPVSIITVSHFLPNFQSLPDWKDLSATKFNVNEWLDHGGPGVSAKFAKVAGSVLLDEQIRSIMNLTMPCGGGDVNDNHTNNGWHVTAPPIAGSVSKSTLGVAPNGSGSSRSGSRIHVFGHSHRPKDFTFQGIRYIHNPLGKPKERLTRTVSPNVDFQLLWKNSNDDDDSGSSAGGEVAGTTLLRYWEECAGGKEALWKRFDAMNPGRYQRMEQRKRVKQRAGTGVKLTKEVADKQDITPTS